MPRFCGRFVALALVIVVSMTLFDLDAFHRSMFDASQRRKLRIPEQVTQQVQAFQEQQISLESTIITAYFQLPASKHSHKDYIKWAKNALCIDDPLIVFTQLKFVEEFLQLRSHATNRTLIIPIELEDIEVGDTIHHPDEFWKNQTKFDRRAKREKIKPDGNLYKLWLAKSWFVNQAIQMNPFNSSVYSWMDIGQMRREDKFCGDVVVRHPEMVPDDGRIMLFMRREVNEEDQYYYNNTIFSKGFQSFYIAGGWISGRVDAWQRFMTKMEESIVLYDQKGVGLAEDQSILQSTCMRNPGLCAVTRQNKKYHGFFAAKYRFLHGGNICTWDPAMGIPSKEEDPGFYNLSIADSAPSSAFTCNFIM